MTVNTVYMGLALKISRMIGRRMADGSLTLSALGDEISPAVDEQLDALSAEGIRHLELRGLEETNVLDLSGEQLQRLSEALDASGFDVSAIASPIGKVDVTSDFEQHYDRFRRAIELAETLRVEYVRVFSYYYPDGDDPEAHRDTVLDRMERKVERAEEAGVTLVHENERGVYGDTPERCRDIVESVDSPRLRVLFDPANFVVDGIEAYPHAYEELADHVSYVHVKDANFGEDIEIEPAGEGDAEIPEIVEALLEDGYEGFVSLEPHLTHYGGNELEGPEAFRVAARSFKDVLDEVGASYA